MYLRSIPLKVYETRMLYRIVVEGNKKHHIQNGCALGGPSRLTPVINMPSISLGQVSGQVTHWEPWTPPALKGPLF